MLLDMANAKTICISINFDYYHEEKFEETIKNLMIEEMNFFRGDYIRKQNTLKKFEINMVKRLEEILAIKQLTLTKKQQ